MRQRFIVEMRVPPTFGVLARHGETLFHGPFEGQLEAMKWAERLERTWPEGTTWSTRSLWDPIEG